MTVRRSMGLLGVTLGVGCGMAGQDLALQEEVPNRAVATDPRGPSGDMAGGAEMDEERADAKSAPARKVGAFDSTASDDGVLGGIAAAPAGRPVSSAGEDTHEAASEERTRTWFPEAFLWQPLVETGDDGLAELTVTVPDQLTTWRVLALANDRRGQQAGTVHTFDSTRPLYVDPVVPGWLMAGDRVVLPVQVVNTTTNAMVAALDVRATGAMTGLGRASVALSAGGSDVRTIPLQVTGSGVATVTAALAAGDARDSAERQITVLPTGRPVQAVRGGTLASTRSLELPGTAGADASTEELHVVVFPGPLAVLQAELERLSGGARPADGAYGFALASRVGALSFQSGVEVDEAAVRALQVLAWQRIVAEARSPDAGRAVDLLLSLSDPGEHELAIELVPRLVDVVTHGQRADGTWSRGGTATLQRILVETAVAARALPEDATGPRLRAAGAIERHGAEIDDVYTASVVLAAGLVTGEQQTRLRQLVIDALTTTHAGAASVAVPVGVHNPWGTRPAKAEVLAWTWLALHDAGHQAAGDLLSELMSGWSARAGFGAGRADAVALEAIATGLPGTTDPVTVSLSIGGRVVATAALDPSQPKVPAVLDARPSEGEVVLSVVPEVPGLAFLATRRSWVPWSGADRQPGVEVEVSGRDLAVGREGELTLEVAAPSGSRLTIEQGLPAGCAVDEVSARARAAAVGAEIRVFTDRVVVQTRAFSAGEVLSLTLPVTPAFAGRYSTVPLAVAVDGGRPVAMAPMDWRVARVGGS